MAEGTPLVADPPGAADEQAISFFERELEGRGDGTEETAGCLPQYSGGWLCPTGADRDRLIDMSPAVRRSRLASSAFCGLGVMALTPWEPQLLALFVPVPIAMFLLERRLHNSARPERLVAGAIGFFALLMLIGVALTGGAQSAILPWVAIPVLTAAARFRVRVLLVGAALALGGLLAAVAVGTSAAPWSHPTPVIAVLALLAAMIAAQYPLLSAEQRWRRDAILDPLTGLLNRQGLERRFDELAQQARITGASVAVIVFDLDNFKRLNDTYGHARGDAVLKDIAYLLRKELRAFELIYRIGGEELLVILPDSDLDAAHAVAERIRRALSECTPGGLSVTASFGVSSARGDQLELKRLFESADRAVYRAKATGRNQVALAPPLLG